MIFNKKRAFGIAFPYARFYFSLNITKTIILSVISGCLKHEKRPIFVVSSEKKLPFLYNFTSFQPSNGFDSAAASEYNSGNGQKSDQTTGSSKISTDGRGSTLHQRKKTRKAIWNRIRFTAAVVAGTFISETALTGMALEADSSVMITADGETHTVRSSGETVEALLAREGIVLGADDEVNYPLGERIEAGMHITVDRVEFVEHTTSEPIAYRTVTAESPLHRIGTSFVSAEGQSGRRDTTVIQKIVNGETVYTYEAVTSELPPSDEVISVGTALNTPYSKKEGDFSLENGIPTEYAYRLDGKVTAYTAPEGSGTYSGRKLEIGTVAVDPNEIPFGSELYICSKDGKKVYGYAIAADTGSLTDVVADVFMGTTAEHFDEACDWGAQDAYVYVLTVGDNSISWL